MLKEHISRSLFPFLLSGVLTGTFVYVFIDGTLASLLLFCLMGMMCYTSIYLYSAIYNAQLRPHLPVYASVLINSVVSVLLIYINLIIIIGLVNPNGILFVFAHWRDTLLNPSIQQGMIFGLALSVAINVYLSISELFGQRNLINLVLGRYSKAHEVERVFMFADLKDSTSIAEQLGHKRFLDLLNAVFEDMSKAISKHKGQVYKYVGDEIIIVWKPREAFKKAACLQTFIDMDANIKKRKAFYTNRFGLLPAFKAGLHGGYAITGELGYFRKEITFLGDVVNTSARIEGECKRLNQKLVYSEYIASRTNVPDGFEQIELGEHHLRGKSDSIQLFGLNSSKIL